MLKGKCLICLKTLRKNERHIINCTSTIQDAAGDDCYLFYVASCEHWLYILVNADTTIKQLDKFLKEYWLECCGHKSVMKNFMGQLKLTSIVKPENMEYEYDMGSTSFVDINYVATIKYKTKGITVVMHNVDNNVVCSTCHKNKCYCMDCNRATCVDCEQKCGKCENDEFYEYVNSPRLGLCGVDSNTLKPNKYKYI